MRVALDVSALTEGLRSGTAVYLYRLVRALDSLGTVELDVLYNGMPGPGVALAESLAGPHARVLVHTWLWRALPGPLFDRPYPRPLAAAARAADVFHVGEFVYPRLPATLPVVATVHDVTTKLFPQWHGWPNRLLHHKRLRWIARHAHRILIDAEATRADTARVLGVPPARCDVVPLARGTAPVTGTLPEVRARFALGTSPLVLFVGTLEPRKNVGRLVAAMQRLPARLAGVKLVLAGRWGWRTGALRGALDGAPPGRIVVTGGVDDATLAALYRAAAVFAYPSLYEGFGLPVLEAMAAGAPVITSKGGALEEVAGSAAELVDPLDVDAIAAALERLLCSDPARAERRALGFARERSFTWRRTAEQTLGVYRHAAER